MFTKKTVTEGTFLNIIMISMLCLGASFFACCVPKNLGSASGKSEKVGDATSINPRATNLDTELPPTSGNKVITASKVKTPAALAGGESDLKDPTTTAHTTNLEPLTPISSAASTAHSNDAQEAPKNTKDAHCADRVAEKLKADHEKYFQDKSVEVWSLYSGGGFAGSGVGHFQVRLNKSQSTSEFLYYAVGDDSSNPQKFVVSESELLEFQKKLAEGSFSSPLIFCPTVMDAFAFSYQHAEYLASLAPKVLMTASFLDADTPDKPRGINNIISAFDYLKSLKVK